MLVLNDSRVLPARVEPPKPTGGKVELLFLRPRAGTARAPDRRAGRRSRARRTACARGGPSRCRGARRSVWSDCWGRGGGWSPLSRAPTSSPLLQRDGELPLAALHQDASRRPPGLPDRLRGRAGLGGGAHSRPALHAGACSTGSAAAGVETVRVTLHVGLDTFQPIREPTVEDHVIHREAFSVSRGGAATHSTRPALTGRRLVAVGTTATRVLETLLPGERSPGGPRTAPLVGSTDDLHHARATASGRSTRC